MFLQIKIGVDYESWIHSNYRRSTRGRILGYLSRSAWREWQGETIEEAKTNLREAIELILEDRREDILRGLPEGAIQEKVFVEWNGEI